MAGGGMLLGRRLDRWDGAVAAYAAVAACARPLTAPAAVAVILPAVVFVAVAVRRRRPPRVGLARRHVAPWVLLGVLLAAREVAGLAWGPTLSLLLDPVLDTYPGRLGGWLVWLGAGRWLVTR
jgi:hypothetical protein